jgi:hypothetical protein
MNACSVCRNEQTCCFLTYLCLFNVFKFLLSFLNLKNNSTSKLSERDVNALVYVWVCFVLFSTTSPFVAFHIFSKLQGCSLYAPLTTYVRPIAKTYWSWSGKVSLKCTCCTSNNNLQIPLHVKNFCIRHSISLSSDISISMASQYWMCNKRKKI